MNYGPIIANSVRIFIQENKWRVDKWTEKNLRECSDDIELQLNRVENLMVKDKSKGFEVIKAR